jgi:hypothetical protein
MENKFTGYDLEFESCQNKKLLKGTPERYDFRIFKWKF